MRAFELYERHHFHAPATEEIVAKIKRDCQPWLAAANGHIAYRGIRGATEDFVDGKVNQNRRPIDIEPAIHDEINDIFQSLGFVAQRGNSLFVSGSIKQAKFYGRDTGGVFVVLPKGNFEFTWSPYIDDLNGQADEIEMMDSNELERFINNNYQDGGNLREAIETGNEIMLHCKEFYAIDSDLYKEHIESELSSLAEESKPLEEGVEDPDIFKAIIMAGAPGSGKSHVAQELTGGSGLRSVNSDNFINIGIDNHKERSVKSSKQLDVLLQGRLGVIIDGTGRNIERIQQTKKILDEHGYETKLVYVDVELETALKRNTTRNRVEPEEFVKQAHLDSKKSIQTLQHLFGDNFIYINNEDNTDFSKAWKNIRKWLNQPVNTPYASDWKADELSKKYQDSWK